MFLFQRKYRPLLGLDITTSSVKLIELAMAGGQYRVEAYAAEPTPQNAINEKAIVDAETEQILGATVLGIEGGEVMAVFQLAMMGHLKYSVLRDAVFAHPTLAESLNNLFFHFDDGK